MLTKDDRLIQPLRDDRFNTLDGNRVLVREDIKGQKRAIESARFGPPGRRVFWLNDDDTVEPLWTALPSMGVPLRRRSVAIILAGTLGAATCGDGGNPASTPTAPTTTPTRAISRLSGYSGSAAVLRVVVLPIGPARRVPALSALASL